MIAIELKQIEVDHCVACGGVWLDSGELELLLGSIDQSRHLISALGRDSHEIKRKCPICLKKMDEVFYGKSGEIVLDKCHSGDGIWFDKGELEKVIHLNSFNGSGEVLHLLRDIFVQK